MCAMTLSACESRNDESLCLHLLPETALLTLDLCLLLLLVSCASDVDSDSESDSEPESESESDIGTTCAKLLLNS